MLYPILCIGIGIMQFLSEIKDLPKDYWYYTKKLYWFIIAEYRENVTPTFSLKKIWEAFTHVW